MKLHRPPRQKRVPETPFYMEGSLGKTSPSHPVFRSGGLTTVNCGTRSARRVMHHSVELLADLTRVVAHDAQISVAIAGISDVRIRGTIGADFPVSIAL